MNIYVVTSDAYESNDLLIKQLARIVVQPNKATPVIVVDDLFNLDQLSRNDAPVASEVFQITDFKDINQAGGGEIADAKVGVTRLVMLKTEWVQFEFGHSDPETFIGLVRKLSRYNYMAPTLRKKNLVFIVPRIEIMHFSRILNESFNNISHSKYAIQESGSVNMLFRRATLERLIISLPLITPILSRLYRLAKSSTRWFVKST